MWQSLLRTIGKWISLPEYQTCLIQASIDSRLFEYPKHHSSLPSINSIGKVNPDLANNWSTNDSWPKVAFFLCSLLDGNQ